MQKQSENATEQTQLVLLKNKIFTPDHSIQQTINVLDEVFIDWMSSDHADDSSTRYLAIHAHKNMKDVLLSIMCNQVTTKVELISQVPT